MFTVRLGENQPDLRAGKVVDTYGTRSVQRRRDGTVRWTTGLPTDYYVLRIQGGWE